MLGAGSLLYLVWFLFARPSEGDGAAAADALTMPETVTPFSVLALLHQVRARCDLSAEQQAALAADVHRIEAGHFGKGAEDGAAPDVDLDGIARRWLAAAR